MLSFTEENYLKAILKLTIESDERQDVGTNELASHIGVKPATATDMLKKLKLKNLIEYEKYGKVSLTESGKKNAIEVLRKHRLWETFLFQKLDFTWDEVHAVAEQLEHIQSKKLIDKLDKFLEFPEFDPHGDAIPNAKGEIRNQYKKTLSQVEVGNTCRMMAVKDNSVSFLQYVVKVGLGINDKIKVISKQEYDAQLLIEINGKTASISNKFAENIFVVCNNCVIGKPCVKSKCEIK